MLTPVKRLNVPVTRKKKMKKKTLQTDIQDKACPVLSCHIVALYNIYIINIITDKKLKQLT